MNKDDEALLQFFGVQKKQHEQAVTQVVRTSVVQMSPEEQAIVDAADRYLNPQRPAPPKLKPQQNENANWKSFSGWIAATFSWAFVAVIAFYLLTRG